MNAADVSKRRHHEGGSTATRRQDLISDGVRPLWVMLSVFNLVDLLLLDWPLVAIVPRFMVLPGTEGLAGYKDYGFHFRGFLIGNVLIVVASGLMAGVAAALF